jgi:hypothetical protein
VRAGMTRLLASDFLMALLAIVVLSGSARAAELPGQPGLNAPGIHRRTGKGSGGLYEATTQRLVPMGDQIRDNNWPPCEGPANEVLKTAAAAMIKASNADPKIKLLASLVVGPLGNKVDEIARQSGGDLGLLIAPHRKATCIPLAVALPVGSEVISFSLTAGDGNRVHGCLADGNGHYVCNVEVVNGKMDGVPRGIAFCGWEAVPVNVTHIGPDNQLFGAVFKNWSHKEARWASLTVVFRPPPKWHRR